ncbi:hypothetical protein BDN72DRAFT_960832 [Pluteus cervinus]|uniref:Uncharacterized protein n=1 Tax=Pluteus cervinus TaxID=181527 RepID=A0ACD3AQT2_9AGAR|nr:hypothetical protein BDN72DRAFT_960832 [Pluteus cervinus]
MSPNAYTFPQDSDVEATPSYSGYPPLCWGSRAHAALNNYGYPPVDTTVASSSSVRLEDLPVARSSSAPRHGHHNTQGPTNPLVGPRRLPAPLIDETGWTIFEGITMDEVERGDFDLTGLTSLYSAASSTPNHLVRPRLEENLVLPSPSHVPSQARPYHLASARDYTTSTSTAGQATNTGFGMNYGAFTQRPACSQVVERSESSAGDVVGYGDYYSSEYHHHNEVYNATSSLHSQTTVHEPTWGVVEGHQSAQFAARWHYSAQDYYNQNMTTESYDARLPATSYAGYVNAAPIADMGAATGMGAVPSSAGDISWPLGYQPFPNYYSNTSRGQHHSNQSDNTQPSASTAALQTSLEPTSPHRPVVPTRSPGYHPHAPGITRTAIQQELERGDAVHNAAQLSNTIGLPTHAPLSILPPPPQPEYHHTEMSRCIKREYAAGRLNTILLLEQFDVDDLRDFIDPITIDGKKWWICPLALCNTQCKCPSDFKKHLERLDHRRKKDRHECKVCGLTATRQDALDRHKQARGHYTEEERRRGKAKNRRVRGSFRWGDYRDDHPATPRDG